VTGAPVADEAGSQSPCRNICIMDHAAGFCTGCGRTISEITNWLGYSAEARRAINEAARERLAVSAGPPPPRS